MNRQEIDQAVTLAKQNNQKAFASLFDAHWEYVYGYLLKQIKDDVLAEELAIKTFGKAFDKIDTFNQNFTFKTWLISISKNLKIDFHRSEKTKGQMQYTPLDKNHINDLSDDNPSPEDLLILQQNLKELIENIKLLKPLYAKVIRLRYFEELSYKEIAEKTTLPINTVKVTLLRAKKVLAEKINETWWNQLKN